MKFIVNSQQLLRQLQSLGGVLSSNNTMPIINCYHFHLEENRLTVKTTDLSTTLVSTIDVETGRMEQPEEVAIPSKMLLDVMKTFDDVPVTFNVDSATHSISLQSGDGEYSLAGLDADTFPTMPATEATGSVTMSSTALVEATGKFPNL